MAEIKATIITIGDELLIGQTVDTNAVWIGQELNRIGVWVNRRVTITDEADAILNTLSVESENADIILITGGLGPTDDDITKTTLCQYFESEMILNKAVLKHVEERVKQSGSTLLQRNKNQAMVPTNCRVLFNERGTAPGLWFEKEDTVYVAMPGIPYEMKGLMMQRVIPEISERFSLPAILHRTQLVSGIPESVLAKQLEGFEQSLPAHIHLAYLPINGFLKLRLTAKGQIVQRIAHELDQYGMALENKVRDFLVAKKDISLQELLGEKLRKQNLRVATAESCTGGYIGHLITSVSGSSDYFEGAAVTYNNRLKQRWLNVPEKILMVHGAVSEEVVTAMLQGVLGYLNTDVGIAVSGIMGPGGGSEEKPVGTVWMAAGAIGNIRTRKLQLRYNRLKNIELTANYALLLLLEYLKDIDK
ncbi:MAG TPA: CinA family nicotinamide mononucleotide deamidase-related protein [Chitinophagaceae bacterium]|nr:CinA family nicotinamide mononucleotide deamidase-related protein [Chitinophagaceae bacterium]